MVDRQDIDALLISALYGELTPADEARLSTHLESHPADRTALADLTRARTALRESRILTVQLDPPQSISALLLQEAARRAPKTATAKEPEAREGWFQRFVRSFASRPMMAAAAMLVVVIGVASTIKLSGGTDAQMAKETSTLSHDERVESAADQSPRAASEPMLLQKGEVDGLKSGRQAGSSFDVTLADQQQQLQTETTNTSDVKTGEASASAKPDPAPKDTAKLEGATRPPPAIVKAKPSVRTDDNTYLDVRPSNPQPKELEDETNRDRKKPDTREKKKIDRGEAGDDQPNAGGGGAPGGGTENAPTDTTTRAPSRNQTPAVTTPQPTPGQGRVVSIEEQKQEPEDTTAARGEHDKVVAAARANDCAKAGKLAADLAARAPGYYRTQIQTDRELRKCISHINAAHERESSNRARNLKRTTDEKRSNEPAKATRPAAPASRR